MILNFLISLILISGTGGTLHDSIDNYLKLKLNDYTKYEFKIKSLPRSAGPDQNIIINNEKKFRLAGRYAYIPITVKTEKRNFNSIISLDIKLYTNVLAARRDIKKGENLSSSDFTTEEQEVTNYRNVPVRANSSLQFYRVTKNIKRGEILTEEFLESIPIIKAGATVTANIFKGNVHIKLNAVAKQDGHIGELIRIDASNNKYYKAEVLDPNNVKIIE